MNMDTGTVAVGVEYPSGTCVHEWTRPPISLSMYPSIHAVEKAHGHKLKIVWND